MTYRVGMFPLAVRSEWSAFIMTGIVITDITICVTVDNRDRQSSLVVHLGRLDNGQIVPLAEMAMDSFSALFLPDLEFEADKSLLVDGYYWVSLSQDLFPGEDWVIGEYRKEYDTFLINGKVVDRQDIGHIDYNVIERKAV